MTACPCFSRLITGAYTPHTTPNPSREIPLDPFGAVHTLEHIPTELAELVEGFSVDNGLEISLADDMPFLGQNLALVDRVYQQFP